MTVDLFLLYVRCFGFHPCTRGQGPHGQPRCMVLASDEWRVFDIDYTNQHYELLPFLCHNHALFHGQMKLP
uniref:Predicted protein n=1 Tax=Hordeum vulgare subsp. vulgare TaxID=112509 RepID=F2D756_HORVV|nr:predicted protein [Hordeum vulgare subsp. vulgare]